MSEYEVRDVVCDYGIYEDGELKLILNSRSNALKIKDILEVDLQHRVYSSVDLDEIRKETAREILQKFNEYLPPECTACGVGVALNSLYEEYGIECTACGADEALSSLYEECGIDLESEV